MHFSSTAAIVALSALGVTYAAPLANPQGDLARRKVNYEVVNVDGESSSESSSSEPPKAETVTQTVESLVTAPGAPAVPVTVTITASPSASASSSAAASSAPASHLPPPSGASFFASNSEFFHRGLRAVGAPADFASSYASSSTPSASRTLAARDGWYSPEASSVSTPSPSLGARQYPGEYSPSSAASSSSVTPSASLEVRQYDAWYSPSSATPSSTSSASVSLEARQYGGWYSASSVASSSSVTPVSLVVREFGGWYSGAPSSTGPASSTETVPVSATPLAARNFGAASSSDLDFAPAQPTPPGAQLGDSWYSGASSSSATPTSTFSLPASAIPMAY